MMMMMMVSRRGAASQRAFQMAAGGEGIQVSWGIRKRKEKTCSVGFCFLLAIDVPVCTLHYSVQLLPVACSNKLVLFQEPHQFLGFSHAGKLQ